MLTRYPFKKENAKGNVIEDLSPVLIVLPVKVSIQHAVDALFIALLFTYNKHIILLQIAAVRGRRVRSPAPLVCMLKHSWARY